MKANGIHPNGGPSDKPTACAPAAGKLSKATITKSKKRKLEQAGANTAQFQGEEEEFCNPKVELKEDPVGDTISASLQIKQDPFPDTVTTFPSVKPEQGYNSRGVSIPHFDHLPTPPNFALPRPQATFQQPFFPLQFHPLPTPAPPVLPRPQTPPPAVPCQPHVKPHQDVADSIFDDFVVSELFSHNNWNEENRERPQSLSVPLTSFAEQLYETVEMGREEKEKVGGEGGKMVLGGTSPMESIVIAD